MECFIIEFVIIIIYIFMFRLHVIKVPLKLCYQEE